MPDADLLKRLATEPIPGDNPCGESARYDEAFGLLEAEIAKLENPAGGEVDWRAVETGAAELLEKRSKDALLAAWLARALWQREGFAGLAAGLATIRGLFETFWDQMHPQRIRPRRAALEWLGEKLAAAIDDGQLNGDAAGAAACLAEIEAIRTWSDGRFEGEDCGLLGLLSRLRSAPQAAGEVAAEAASGEAAGGSAGGGGAGSPGAPAGPISNRVQAVARLRELADWWARHEPSSPMVPLLRRAVTWSDLDFQALFAQLLRSKGEAKEYMWDVLGIEDQQPSG
jgi:type VI secretion system protein VasJ